VVTPLEAVTAELLSVMRKAGKPLLEQVELIDRFEGEPLDAGCCSRTFRLRYRDPARTLTDADVDGVHAKVRQSLLGRPGVVLRS
jgi:phenylalanyl-tRNA synthetase beta chain